MGQGSMCVESLDVYTEKSQGGGLQVIFLSFIHL